MLLEIVPDIREKAEWQRSESGLGMDPVEQFRPGAVAQSCIGDNELREGIFLAVLVSSFAFQIAFGLMGSSDVAPFRRWSHLLERAAEKERIVLVWINVEN